MGRPSRCRGRGGARGGRAPAADVAALPAVLLMPPAAGEVEACIIVRNCKARPRINTGHPDPEIWTGKFANAASRCLACWPCGPSSSAWRIWVAMQPEQGPQPRSSTCRGARGCMRARAKRGKKLGRASEDEDRQRHDARLLPARRTGFHRTLRYKLSPASVLAASNCSGMSKVRSP